MYLFSCKLPVHQEHFVLFLVSERFLKFHQYFYKIFLFKSVLRETCLFASTEKYSCMRRLTYFFIC